MYRKIIEAVTETNDFDFFSSADVHGHSMIDFNILLKKVHKHPMVDLKILLIYNLALQELIAYAMVVKNPFLFV